MNQDFKPFVRKLTVFSAIIAAIATTLYFLLPVGMVTQAMPFILIFFMAHTLLFHKMATKVIEKNLRRFTNFYMISTIARLFLFLIIMILYSLLNPKDAKYFIVCFFVFYVLFTFFELYIILPQLRQNQAKP
jgi:hypothetical protein